MTIPGPLSPPQRTYRSYSTSESGTRSHVGTLLWLLVSKKSKLAFPRWFSPASFILLASAHASVASLRKCQPLQGELETRVAEAGASPKVRMTQLSPERPRVVGGRDAVSTRGDWSSPPLSPSWLRSLTHHFFHHSCKSDEGMYGLSTVQL